MGDIDAELRRYRVDLHSIAMGFPEPGSAYKLRKTFEDDFGDEVPFRKFGYMDFDSFLNDHLTLERVMVEGKTCYRAKMSERSADIHTLVACQKKKKRRNGKNPAAFQRTTQNRNFQNRPSGQQSAYNNYNQRSFRGGMGGATPGFNGGRGRTNTPSGSTRSSFSNFRQQTPSQYNGIGASSGAFRANGFGSNNHGFGTNNGFGASSGGFGSNNSGFGASSSGFGASSGGFGSKPSASHMQPTPIVGRNVSTPMEAGGPAAGKARIIAALKKCQGNATITKLNHCYQQLYDAQIDADEMQKFFSTNNFAAIHRDWLSEEMDLNPDPSGQWVYMSKEIAKQQQEWAAAHKDLTVENTSHKKWDKPSVKELYDKVVAMLVNMYPEPLQISQMSEIYKRAHGVDVDPMNLYCKAWEDLVTSIFRDNMVLKPNGSVVLSDKAVRVHGLSATAAPVATHATIKRVTAVDLGLEYEDDSESDEDEEESNSIGSTPPGHTAFQPVPPRPSEEAAVNSTQGSFATGWATASNNMPAPQKSRSPHGSTASFQSTPPCQSEEAAVNFTQASSGGPSISGNERRRPRHDGPPPPYTGNFVDGIQMNNFPSVKELARSLKIFLHEHEASGSTRDPFEFGYMRH